MGVHEGRGRLAKSLKELMERWGETKLTWNDAVARDFERTHIIPVEIDMRNAVGAMDTMSQLIQKIKHECGE